MRFGSLFSGIGGIDKGLEDAGWECVWQVEKDPFCQQVLNHHWPHVPLYSDVRKFGRHISTVDFSVDAIVGGFPCQDISVAGLGAGLKGKRSGLWYQFHRIIKDTSPEWVLIENVYRGWKRWVPAVRRSLHDLGRASLCFRMRAKDLGAPHERARGFILSVPYAHSFKLRELPWWRSGEGGPTDTAELALPGQGLAHPGGESQPKPGSQPNAKRKIRKIPLRSCGPTLADQHSQRLERVGLSPEVLAEGPQWDEPDGRYLPFWPFPRDDLQSWGEVQTLAKPAVCSLADGLPPGLVRTRRHSLKAYGNAVVPPKAEWIGHWILDIERRCNGS